MAVDFCSGKNKQKAQCPPLGHILLLQIFLKSYKYFPSFFTCFNIFFFVMDGNEQMGIDLLLFSLKIKLN